MSSVKPLDLRSKPASPSGGPARPCSSHQTLYQRASTTGHQVRPGSQHVGTVTHVGNCYTEMIDDGEFEKTAHFLLTCPSVLNCLGRTRIDWWMDTLQGQDSAAPRDKDTHAAFAYWPQWLTWRKLRREWKAGTLKIAAESQYQRSLMQIGVEDETHTIPTHEFWDYILPFPANHDGLFRNHTSDVFRTMHHLPGRRLVLLNDLGAPPCPAAKLMAVAPHAVEVGDKICLVAGCAMPFLLRPSHIEPHGAVATSMPRACFVGEACVNSGGEPVDMFGD
ncbi:hypothetical protein LTR95_018075, partial [Oleoguttula sp. CCFEE 5521]